MEMFKQLTAIKELYVQYNLTCLAFYHSAWASINGLVFVNHFNVLTAVALPFPIILDCLTVHYLTFSSFYLIVRKMKMMQKSKKMKMKSQMEETTALMKLRKLLSSGGLTTCSCLIQVSKSVTCPVINDLQLANVTASCAPSTSDSHVVR